MRFLTLVIAVLSVTFGTLVLAGPPVKHDFTNLQRLSQALDNFNYPDRGTNSITVWRQGGGKGTSVTYDDHEVDLTSAVKMGSAGVGEKPDLTCVAVLRADGRSILFVDMQGFIESGQPSGVVVKRGDLVALLVR